MPVVQVTDISFQYQRGRVATPALAGVTAALRPGITGIVGANGAGKSTLLRLLMGSLRPLTGSVTIDGKSPAEYRRTNPFGFVPDRLAFDGYLTVGAFLGGLTRMMREQRSSDEESFLAWRWQDLADKRLGALSLGEARRVELAAALVGQPPMLLLDEPTNGLDPLSVRELRETLTELKKGERTIVVASHHLDELQRIADSIVVIRNGRIADQARSTEILSMFGSLEAFFVGDRSISSQGGSDDVA